MLHLLMRAASHALYSSQHDEALALALTMNACFPKGNPSGEDGSGLDSELASKDLFVDGCLRPAEKVKPMLSLSCSRVLHPASLREVAKSFHSAVLTRAQVRLKDSSQACVKTVVFCHATDSRYGTDTAENTQRNCCRSTAVLRSA